MKKLKTLILTGFLLSFHLFSNAQTFSDLKDSKGRNFFEEARGKVFFRFTNLDGKHTKSTSAPTINASIRSDKSKKGGLRYRFENAFLGDGLYAIVRGVKRMGENKSRILSDRSYQTLTSGWIGWHNLAINAYTKDKLIVAPGISFGDHIIASNIQTNGQSGTRVIDPAGYYFYAGPYVLASYVINKKMWVDAYVNYDITFTKVSNPSKDYIKNPGYPLPSVFFIGADVYTTHKIFAGLRLAKLKDSGSFDNGGSRLDFSLGVNF